MKSIEMDSHFLLRTDYVATILGISLASLRLFDITNTFGHDQSHLFSIMAKINFFYQRICFLKPWMT